MNALSRFLVFGMQDADRRVAAALAPPSLELADRYLKESAIVAALDRITLRLAEWWASSDTRRFAAGIRDAVAPTGAAHWPERYRAIGVMLIAAVGVNVAATVIEGNRPGWFWLIVPALTFAFAVFVLIASRSTHTPQ
jgi:hypothetical protein